MSERGGGGENEREIERRREREWIKDMNKFDSEQQDLLGRCICSTTLQNLSSFDEIHDLILYPILEETIVIIRRIIL